MAAAAAAAAAALALQIELRDQALPMVGMRNDGAEATRETTRFMNVHGLTAVGDLAELDPGQAKYLVQIHNDNIPRNVTKMGLII